MKLILEPIRRNHYEQSDRAAVQEVVARAVETNPERFIEKYIKDERSFNGRYIAADLFKEMFEQYRESNESKNRYNAPVHNSAAVLAAAHFRRVISDKSYPKRDSVVFLTGIPGAGKTSSVLTGGKLPDNCRAVFEGQLSNPATVMEKIQQVLDAGLKPHIIVVHTTPENALDNTIKRFNLEGRGASIGLMSAIQNGLPDGLRQIWSRFGERVILKIHDYRDRNDPIRSKGWKNLPILESEGHHEQIKQRLREALEHHWEAGRISEACYRQAIGAAPLEQSGRRDRGLGGKDDGRHASNDPRRGLPSGDREEIVLTGQEREQGGQALQAGAERLEREQQSLLQSAPIEQTYQESLSTYVQAKHAQIERIEGHLEKLIGQQQTRLQQIQLKAPGFLALPGTRRAWQSKQARQEARLNTLCSRLEEVREIKDGMGLFTPKVEEMATRKMRSQNPELASAWDRMREEARRQAFATQQEKRTHNQNREQGKARTQTLSR